MTFRAINPTTGAFLYETAALSIAERHTLLTRVDTAQHRWRTLTLRERTTFVIALGEALRACKTRLAEALTLEMGKPIVAARAEVDKCVALCEGAGELAQRALANETLLSDDASHVYLRYDALGTILAIMPWNFPYWQALRFAVPALLAGNGVLVKPAPSLPGPAALLDECFDAARAAVASTKAGDAPCHVALLDLDAIDGVIADDRIVGVTLTGSDRAGRHVAQVAGAHLKKVVLELGGSDPFIVLPDADIARAAKVAVAARTVNSGQSCVAAKRFIVCDDVYEEFLALFCAGMRALVVGDPRDEATQIGPIATESVRDGLAEQIRASVALGAHAVVGANDPLREGFFLAPTVLVDIPENSPAARDELFGPVASVFRVRNLDEAVTRANSTVFGLGASVWTHDPTAIARCIAELNVGMIFVNDMVASDPRFPFGGVKQSGLGRELGVAGFREFANQKLVRISR